jgi:hypothetical protein
MNQEEKPTMVVRPYFQERLNVLSEQNRDEGGREA